MLARVPDEDLHALARVGVRRRFAEGASLMRQGEPGDSLHTIMSGLVRISMSSSEGDETILATLRAGDSIGELSLLDGRPRSATATALLDTESLVVTRADFVDWLHARPMAAAAILEALSLRLRRTNELVSDLVSLELPQRLAKQLLYLVEVQAPDGDASSGWRIRINQADLAKTVGATREAVNQHLRRFEDAEWVELKRGSVTVLRPDALRELL